jgi:hypothetical protein
VIFDLDGTLTEPVLDFDAIRAEIGLLPGLPILEQLEALQPATRARAEEIMVRHERDAIARATLSDGCADSARASRDDGDSDLDLDAQRVCEVVETFARAFAFSLFTRRVPARGRAAQAVARGRAGALPQHGRRARGYAGGG